MPVTRLQRLAWLVPGSVLAVLAVGYGTLGAVGLTAFERHTVRQVVTEPVLGLDVDVDGTTRVPGEVRADVLVESRLTQGLTTPDHRVEIVDGRLEVEGDCDALSFGWCQVDTTVRVPVGLDVTCGAAAPHVVEGVGGGVDVASGGGGLTLTDLDGPVSASTGGGGVTATDLRGPLVLRTGGGGIDGRNLRSPTVTVRSGGGGIDLTFVADPTGVDVETGGGGIRIEVPDGDVAYAVDARTGGGTVDTSVRTDPSSDRTIRARSGGGDISIRYSGAP